MTCSPLGCVTADSIQRFDLKTNRTADSIRDSIRTKKTIRRSPT